jgi:hypothetical protein
MCAAAGGSKRKQTRINAAAVSNSFSHQPSPSCQHTYTTTYDHTPQHANTTTTTTTKTTTVTVDIVSGEPTPTFATSSEVVRSSSLARSLPYASSLLLTLLRRDAAIE